MAGKSAPRQKPLALLLPRRRFTASVALRLRHDGPGKAENAVTLMAVAVKGAFTNTTENECGVYRMANRKPENLFLYIAIRRRLCSGQEQQI